MQLFRPSSVVDFGCGLGNFVQAFKKLGAEVRGLDGEWAKQHPLFKITNESEFQLADLELPVVVSKKYDIALCLEVAEHLSPSSADGLVNSLAKASDRIVFSAAIPGQGGIHHVNEQWPQYWKKKFQSIGFEINDAIRDVLWNNENISWWYRQNIFLATRDEFTIDPSLMEKTNNKEPVNYLHPGLLTTRNDEMDKLLNGKEGLRFYVALLWKALKRKWGN